MTATGRRASFKAIRALFGDLVDHLLVLAGLHAVSFCAWAAPRCPLPFAWRRWGIVWLTAAGVICDWTQARERRINLVLEATGREGI